MHPTRPLVLDTNVVLDLLVFDDPRGQVLKTAIASGERRWLATAAMRAELERVLAYPNIVLWLARRGLAPSEAATAALAWFDQCAQVVGASAAARLLCSDPDDQMFIDLAAAHGAEVVSKDRAVNDTWRALESRTASMAGSR